MGRTKSASVIAKARECRVKSLGHDMYEVASPSGSSYTVSVKDFGASGWCDCHWGQSNPDSGLETGCAHMRATWAHLIRPVETPRDGLDAMVEAATAAYNRALDAGRSMATAAAEADAIVGYFE